ncbi:MAG: glycosyltransferase family 39 protein [Bryobacteraceae bacterium]
MWRWIHSGGAFEALSIWFGAGFTIALCIASGSICFGKVLKHWPERFVTGAALLNLAVFFLCCIGLAYPAVFAVLGSAILYFWLKDERLRRPSLRISNYLLAAVFAAYFILYFFNAMAPEASPDGSTYHLGLVGRYLREHGFHTITWNIYASFSEGVEMLFLVAFAFGKHSAAAMVHFAFLVALAWQMVLYARRSGFPPLGICAAVLIFASPLVGKDATSAYNDAGLACVAFTLFSLLQAWDEEHSAKLLIPIGLVAGFAYAIKYTGGVAIVYAIAFVAWKTRRSGEVRPALKVTFAAVLIITPWLAKNWLWVHNPLSPFFNHLFPNAFVTTWFENDYRKYLSLYGLTSRWQIPWAVAVKGQLVGVLGPVFLLAPIALLALRRPEGRQLLLAAAVFGSTYFENIGARFLIPALPFVAMAMMLGLANRALATALALIHAVISWPALIPRYALPGSWSLYEFPYRYAMRFRPAEEYLRSHLPDYDVDGLIDRVTEPGATVFTYRAIPEAYTSRRLLVEYESASNHIDSLILSTGFLRDWHPTWRAGFSFPHQSLRGFRLVQTRAGQGQWRIHELRAFNGGAQLPRAAWAVTAHPFPWGIESAVDSNPVTFWECGDPLSKGSYVEARFAFVEDADSVLLETSPNQPELRLELDGETASGEWKHLSANPDIFTANVPDLRRAAVEELKRRGIDYILLFESDELSKAVRDGGEAAGMEEVGQSSGARLYRLR